MIIHCSLCKQDKDSSLFYKDKRRYTGFGSRCKPCQSARDKQRRTYNEVKKVKDAVRNKSKRIYKETFECSVLSCGKKAELHHINYDDASEVIPLCKKHHRDVHSLETLMNNINELKEFEL